MTGANKEVEMDKITTAEYKGIARDQLTGETKMTRAYTTYVEAHQAAERLCKRTFGARGTISVE